MNRESIQSIAMHAQVNAYRIGGTLPLIGSLCASQNHLLISRLHFGVMALLGALLMAFAQPCPLAAPLQQPGSEISQAQGFVSSRFAVRSWQAQPGERREENLFRVETLLVLVDVLVLDERSGAPVAGLSGQDLIIFEDGVEQQISHFSHDRLPLAVLLMVDTSTSVRPFFTSIVQAARDSLGRLREQDRIAIMAFAGTIQLVQGFSSDRALLAAKIQDVDKATKVGENLTWIDHSIHLAAQYMRRQTSRPERRVMLVISDNEEAPLPSQGFSQSQAMTQLDEGGIVLCSILRGGGRLEMIYGPGKKNRLLRFMRNSYKPGSLEFLSHRTGCLAFPPDSSIDQAMPQLIDLLRTRYTLGYYPSNPIRDGRLRRIQVRLSDSGARRFGNPSLRARYGYILSPSTALPSSPVTLATPSKPPFP